MGLLTQGQPLQWDEIKKYSKIVQDKGIRQFIRLYNGSKNRADGQFKWGDEIEYILVKFNHQARIAYMNLGAERVFHKLAEQERKSKKGSNVVWHPEFAAYMVESTPRLPYDCDEDLIAGLCTAEANMKERRRQVISVLDQDESFVSLTNFPRHGCLESSWPVHYPQPESSAIKSIFVPDEIVFAGHPRFKLVATNIMARRQSKVAINVPIFFDKNTPRPFIENFPNEESRKAAKPNHVYMDSTAFGMGCCCLQITFQATHLKEAKTLYDQMIPLAPILAALSASSPAYRGFLTERDCRWNVIADSCDCRTPEERGGSIKDSDGKTIMISKSRYASVSSYLSCPGQAYNDIQLVYNQNYYNQMIANNVEIPIARHIAHLFIRDPIALYREKIEQTDDKTDHFENIQSSNWQTLRFKPPPTIDSPVGWRVEFRPLEVQTTDFENAAYSIFVILLSRVILAYKLNFLMPISLVDANMDEAQKRDAVLESKFWFRKTITNKSNSKPLCNRVTNPGSNSASKCYCQKLNNNNLSNNNVNNNNANTNNIINNLNDNRNMVVNGIKDQTSNLITSPGRNNNSIARSPQPIHDRPITRLMMSNGANKSNNCLVVSTPTKPTNVNEYATQMGINEIINGSERFVGLMPIVNHYVESMSDGSNTNQIAQIKMYLKFLSDRASGRIKTTAKFMRDFVRSHPDYAWDSVVSEPINHDLIVFLDRVSKGELRCPELLGDIQVHL